MAKAAGREAHRPSRRADVVQAAIRVFGRNSFGSTTVADIAAEASMAPAAVYYHFGAKEDVLIEAVRLIADRINAVTEASREDPSVPSERSLDHVVRMVFEWADAHPDEAQLFFLWAVGATPEIADIRRDFVDHHVAGAGRYFRRRARWRRSRDVALRDATDSLAARVAIETAMATAMAWLSEEIFDADVERDDVAGALAVVMGRLVSDPR